MMNLRRRRVRGSVVTYCLFAMCMLLLGSIAVSGIVAASIARAKGDIRAMVAFQGSQAALEQAISKAYAHAKANKGALPDTTYDLSLAIAPLAPGCQATARVLPDPNNNMVGWLTVNSEYQGRTHSLRTYVVAKDVGIWNNAVFAGQSPTGKAINGNVDVRGSLHILGDGESYTDLNGNGTRDTAETFSDKNKNGAWDPGEIFVDANGDGVWTSAEPFNDTNRNGRYEPPLTQAELNTSLSGNAYVGNNYSGLDPELRSLVLAAPKIGGIETLSSEVRVKHGQLDVGGSAKIGTNAILDGGQSKSTIDGSYVSDGYRGDSASRVFSDNGTTESYDLNTLNIKFPLLSGVGAQTSTDPDTGTVYVNHEAFLLSRGMAVPLTSITSSTPAFVYPANGIPDARGNFIRYTPAASGSPAALQIRGIVTLPGSFTITGHIRYSGRGTIYSPGDLVIHDDLLPAPGQTFPTVSVLGMISKGHMVVGDTAQTKLVGAFYAQGIVKTSKQSQIVGSLIGSYYDLGTNVPSIFQAPSLPRNMPPGMPGDFSIISIKVRGWRER